MIGRLAWANLTLSAVGAVVMAPMLAWLLLGHEKAIGPFMPAADLTVIAGMALFAVNVIRAARRP